MIPFIELSFYELSNIEWARGEGRGEWGEGDLRFVIKSVQNINCKKIKNQFIDILRIKIKRS